MKISADGGSNAYFGDFRLYVGCTTSSTSFTNSASFLTNVPFVVGSDLKDAYTFYPPTATLSYCTIESNVITDSDGNYVSNDTAKLMPSSDCTVQPCYNFSLVEATVAEFVTFKVLTTFSGGMTHFSPIASITISVDNTNTD